MLKYLDTQLTKIVLFRVAFILFVTMKNNLNFCQFKLTYYTFTLVSIITHTYMVDQKSRYVKVKNSNSIPLSSKITFPNVQSWKVNSMNYYEKWISNRMCHFVPSQQK